MIAIIDTYPGGKVDLVAKKGYIADTIEITLRFTEPHVGGEGWSSVVLVLRPEQAAQIARKLEEVVGYMKAEAVA